MGENFREGTPVIMNLSEMDDADAKRLVDFAAGLVFAVRGTIERVTNKVFLLSPPNVSVAAEDKQRIADSGGVSPYGVWGAMGSKSGGDSSNGDSSIDKSFFIIFATLLTGSVIGSSVNVLARGIFNLGHIIVYLRFDLKVGCFVEVKQ